MHLDWTDYLDTPDHAVFVNPMPARGVKAPRKRAKPAVKAPPRVKEPTVPELRAFALAMGLKAVTAHTKRELHAMLTSGVYVRPAAYDKQNEKRAAARALASRDPLIGV